MKYRYLFLGLLLVSIGLFSSCGNGESEKGIKLVFELNIANYILELANNPNDSCLTKSLYDANEASPTTRREWIKEFGEAYDKNNPKSQISGLFVGPKCSGLSATSDNAEVLAYLSNKTIDAYKATRSVVDQRLKVYGEKKSSILDIENSTIAVFLYKKYDHDRVLNYLLSKGNLQFFAAYSNQEMFPFLNALNNSSGQNKPVATNEPEPPQKDTASLSQLINSSNSKDGRNQLFSLLRPNSDNNGNLYNGPQLGYAMSRDTAALNRLLALAIAKSQLPKMVRFIYSTFNEKQKMLWVYAIKLPSSDTEMLDSRYISSARKDYSLLTKVPIVNIEMNEIGTRKWAALTRRCIGNYIAVVYNDTLFSCPRVENQIASGNIEISNEFTEEGAVDFSRIITSKSLTVSLRLLEERAINEKGEYITY